MAARSAVALSRRLALLAFELAFLGVALLAFLFFFFGTRFLARPEASETSSSPPPLQLPPALHSCESLSSLRLTRLGFFAFGAGSSSSEAASPPPPLTSMAAAPSSAPLTGLASAVSMAAVAPSLPPFASASSNAWRSAMIRFQAFSTVLFALYLLARGVSNGSILSSGIQDLVVSPSQRTSLTGPSSSVGRCASTAADASLGSQTIPGHHGNVVR
eukprot:Amastigsp_a3031_53.p2 type:complete len:216 gc:universal Amastigsp_a3031_53:373-1020(+)